MRGIVRTVFFSPFVFVPTSVQVVPKERDIRVFSSTQLSNPSIHPMKPSKVHPFAIAPLCAAISLMFASHSQAATLYWDGN
jgi:hypothetical protein